MVCYILVPLDEITPKSVSGSKGHNYPAQRSLYHEEELSSSYNGCGCRGRRKNSRGLVVRSELTGTGSTGASYPLSGMLLV